MSFDNRRKATVFFLILGICLVALAVALNVGWILLNLQQIALLVMGVVFFALIITGLVLNTTFLLREIKRSEQHDAFINSVTHELKTPIASLKLYLETLQARDVTDVQRKEFYASMLADTNRLNQMVEQVLFAGRTGDKRRRLRPAKIRLNHLLRESVENVRSRYGLGSDALVLSGDAETKIRGDAQELEVAFVNLLDNAVKYSKDQVQIQIQIRDRDNSRVEVQISDQGIGISPTELKRIFGRFYRAPSRAAQKVKGTGLGLAIVKSIVKKHKGKIFAQSAGEGSGSTFIVQLPK